MAVILVLQMLSASVAVAQTPPAGMSQQQFDSLVDSISKSVADRLKAETKPPAEPAKPKPTAASTESAIARSLSGGPDELTILIRQAGDVIDAIPSIGGELRRIYGLLDQRAVGGVSAGVFLALLLAIAVVAVAAEALVLWLLRGIQRRLSLGASAALGLRSLPSLLALVVVDAIALAAMWAVTQGGSALVMSGPAAQHRLANALLLGVVYWRLLVMAFRVVLRPDLPKARLCDVEDGPAGNLCWSLAVISLVLVIFRMVGELMVAVSTPLLTQGAWQAVGVPLYLTLLVWFLVGTQDAARQWLGGLGQAAKPAAFVAHHWLPISVTFFVVVALTQWHGIATGRLHVGNAVLVTLDVAIALLMFETMTQAFVRRLDSQLVGYTPASATPKLADVLARCLRVGVLIVAVAVVAESWVVHVLGLLDEKDWDGVTRSTRTAAISLFIAFVLWELFKYVTHPYMLSSAGASPSGAAAGSPATRLHTMMRLIRTAVAIVLFLIATLVALDDFGVNIAPLIAGASVFGIAISFGSQALVKDVVSGIFYLYDDAFRVGESIDCGKATGTVEGFTIRSIRLRHPDGQVHTIPFGDLGQITNFSRDWTTKKFTLRLARDTDLDRLRQVVKEIGAEMLESSSLKGEIIEPLKMQGIDEVADNALVVRFKFVARPGNPGAVQNEAVARLLKQLPERGIDFAR